MTADQYFPCRCSDCGWTGSSKDTQGGTPIADTGDFSDLLCPKCFGNKIEEADGQEQIKYGYSHDSENYHGPFDTFEKAAEEGFLDSDADLIYVGEVVFPEVSDLVDVDNIIEDISVRAGDEFGEVASDWPDLSKEECAQLENIIVKFLEEKSPVHFWTVENVIEVTRPTDQEATNAQNS